MTLTSSQLAMLRFLMAQSATLFHIVAYAKDVKDIKNNSYILLLHDLEEMDLVECHESQIPQLGSSNIGYRFWTVKLPIDQLEKLLLL